MKAQDLRIGNLVYRENSKLINQKNEVYKIENVNLQSAHKYEPIELTEEWLLKMGFEYKEVYMLGNKYDGWLNFSFHLDINHVEGCYFYHWMGGNIEIKFVHQLQNLYFSLCGEELTIKTSW